MPDSAGNDYGQLSRWASLTPRSRSGRAKTAGAWARLGPLIVGIVVMMTVLLFVRAEFSSRVAPRLLNAWLAYMAGCLLLQTGTAIVSAVPRWRAARSKRFWTAMSQIVSLGTCGGIVVSIWILLPPAGDVLRLLLIVLTMWFIVMVIILNADRLSVFGALAVVASMVSFTLVYDLPYALPLAGFLTMEGVALFMIRRMIWRAAETLEAALAIVRSERDAKTRFIASASHDLQQPLQAAALYFDQILGDADPKARDKAVRGMHSALGSTQALLRTMLDYLRLEAGVVTARLETVVLGDAMAAIALEHQPAAAAAGMRLIVVHSSLQAVADPDMVARSLGNLVANAVRHAQGERILIGARRSGDRVSIWVVDDGNGVPQRDMDRLFDDYAQGSDHGAVSRGGFGLGLSSARRMVELMGGSIDLERRWSGGAAFRIDLARAGRTRP